MIRIVIVEDKTAIREGLVALLDAADGFELMGDYRSCEDMLGRVESDRPDVILMDIGLPGMTGIEGTAAVRKLLPDTAVVVLSVYEDDDNIFDALCAGACGYLVKNTPPARLVEALREAHEGGSPMTSHIARKVVAAFRAARPGADDEVALSEREREILTGLADGDSYKSVADSLYISVDTVRYHIRNVYRKLQVHSQSAAVSKAIRKGLI